MEMFPEPDNTIYDLGRLDKSMEGLFRPGHFNGVAIIMKKLIDIITPSKVYFGEKDFQQLVVMKYLVKKKSIPVEIISCETIRESDGLAMSSRNSRLSPVERQVAPLIYQILLKAKEISLRNDPAVVKNWIIKEFYHIASIKLEYFEIINTETLEPVSTFNDISKCIACIAVHIGNVRLIDNIKFL